jgi:N-acetylglutamate synthase/N-acetylornithine aminotransferase
MNVFLLANRIRHRKGTGLVELELSGRLSSEDSMSILAAIKREEKKVQKQLAKLQHHLSGLQTAAKALSKSARQDVTNAKKRVLSAAGRAKISKAAKKRWAKIKAEAKKAVTK